MNSLVFSKKTKCLFLLLLLIAVQFSLAQNNSLSLDKVEPPHWWIGMEREELQLLVYAKDIGKASIKINDPGVEVIKITPGKSSNYLFYRFSD